MNALSFGALSDVVKDAEGVVDGLKAVTSAFAEQTAKNAVGFGKQIAGNFAAPGQYADLLKQAEGIGTTGAGWAAGLRGKQAEWQAQWGVQATTVAPGPAAGYMPQQTNNFYVSGAGDEALKNVLAEKWRQLQREQRWSPVGG